MNIYNIIDNKKKGKKLSKEEINFWINGVVDGSIPDYKTSALLMAICINGMDSEEAFYLTDAMKNSGKLMERGNITGIIADKHSTGGVSDSISLALVPMLSLMGIKVAKLSGRGLGHTGGTLDKLESFEGFNINLSEQEFERLVEETGSAIAGQTSETVPADRILYALRDVTATIDSIPLIASSIMSKKLCSFADIIVLDVKYGNGAFMETKEEAEELARLMVDIGKRAGRKISAVISRMNEPLGFEIGCNLEVKGVLEVLKGKENDLSKITKIILKEICLLAGMKESRVNELIDQIISDGSAYERLREIVKNQGGTAREFDDVSLLKCGEYCHQILCDKSGYVCGYNTKKLGFTSCVLGGGRVKKEDQIDHASGILLCKKIGDYVQKGDIIATLYSSDKEKLNLGIKEFQNSYNVSSNKPIKEDLVYKIIR